MRRLECLEKKGWKVSVFLSGNGAIATRNNTKIKGTSITDLHKKIFGY